MCGLTFELRRPARWGALAPRRTMELATALRGARASRLVGSPLERGVRRHRLQDSEANRKGRPKIFYGAGGFLQRRLALLGSTQLQFQSVQVAFLQDTRDSEIQVDTVTGLVAHDAKRSGGFN